MPGIVESMNTRFEAKADGYGWPAVWDTVTRAFLPGRFDTLALASERADLLNDGRAPVNTSAPSAITPRKQKRVDDEPTLF